MNFKTKIAGAAATGALFASIFASSAFAASSVTISGNGAGSFNNAFVKNKCKNLVFQGSTTTAITGVVAISKTGKNSANGNTNGTTQITTGNTTTGIAVGVQGGNNSNTADTNCCSCLGGDTTVGITGNGELSVNSVFVINSTKNVVGQNNTTTASTEITTVSKTGGNSANGNTGGNVTINTGDTTTTVDVVVVGGSNTNGL